MRRTAQRGMDGRTWRLLIRARQRYEAARRRYRGTSRLRTAYAKKKGRASRG